MAERVIVAVGDLRRFTEKLIIRLVFDCTANLKEDNPLDTGWSRANWVPRIGRPFTGTAGTRAQAEAGSITTAPQQAGLAEVARYHLDLGEVHITNNVPYVPNLNDGSSRQAPAGYVQAAILRAVRNL